MTKHVLLLMMSLSEKIGETEGGGMRRAQPDGIIRFEANNVSSLDDVYSPEVEVKGVPWKLNLYKDFYDEVYLYLHCPPKQSTQWEIDVTAEYILFNSDNSKNIIKNEIATFSKKIQYVGNARADALIDWNELIDVGKGFIKDDKITVEIRFWISDMRGIKDLPRVTFTDQNDPRHDITLIIDGEKVFANKGILAVHSPFFKALFYGDFSEKDKEEIELKDVDREEFLEMLRVIYTCSKEITDGSYKYLLKLGDRFQIAYVIECVELFLISSEDVTNMEKLRISDQYRLFGLQKHCISELKTKQDFKTVKESPIYKDLSVATMRAIFERHFEISK